MSARRPPKLKRGEQLALDIEKMRRDSESLRVIQAQADALTADGYPPGHPLRTLCLLASGDAGRAQYVFEQTQALLRKKP